LHELVELGVVDVGYLLQDRAGDERKYGEADEVCHQVDWVEANLTGGGGLFECGEELCPCVADFVVDDACQLGRVVAQFVEDEQGQVGVFGKKVDVHGHDPAELLFEGYALCEEVEGYALDEVAEVLHHDDVEQFLFASEIIVKQG